MFMDTFFHDVHWVIALPSPSLCLSLSLSRSISLSYSSSFVLSLALVLLLLLWCLFPQAKVRDLEEKCRNQSEQFNLLSKELEKFRLQAGKFDILGSSTLNVGEPPGSPSKTLSQLLNGLAAPGGKGLSL